MGFEDRKYVNRKSVFFVGCKENQTCVIVTPESEVRFGSLYIWELNFVSLCLACDEKKNTSHFIRNHRLATSFSFSRSS